MTVMHERKPLPTTRTKWVVENIPAGTFRVDHAALADEAVSAKRCARCSTAVGSTSATSRRSRNRATSAPATSATGRWCSGTATMASSGSSTTVAGIAALGMPRGRGQHQGHELFLSRLELWQHGASMACPARTAMARPSTAQTWACSPREGRKLPRLRLRLLRSRGRRPAHLPGRRGPLHRPGRRPGRGDGGRAGAHEYSADANWKLFVENSLDGYHLLPVHVTYFEYLEKFEGTRPKLGGLNEAIDLGNGHAVVALRGPWARPVARWLPALGEQNRERVEAAYAELVRKYGPERADMIGRVDFNVMIFPNLIILDLMGVVIRKLTPTAAGHTKITQWSLATAGEDPDMRARRLDNFITFQGPGASLRRMTSRLSRPASLDSAPATACRGRTSPGACTASTAVNPAATPTRGRCAHSGGDEIN